MSYTIDDINPVLTNFLFPTVMMWNRVEGRPRATKNFDRAIKAEVRDALWLLTKQWQMGEFEGDDAGSPVLAKVRMDTTRLTKYQAGENSAQLFPGNVPLEAQVEQKMLPLSVFQQEISLDLRLMAGRRWKRILQKAGSIDPFWDLSLTYFPIKSPDPDVEEDAAICAHPETWQQYAAVAGRAVDGIELYLFLKSGKNFSELEPGGGVTDIAEGTAKSFVDWLSFMFLQPDDPQDNGWDPSRFEYQFKCSAPAQEGETVLKAEEYYHGHLDWYNFNLEPGLDSLGVVAEEPLDPAEPGEILGKSVRTMLPTPVMFDGMPNTRWWAFESNTINYSYIKPGTQELSKLLFMEFGLVYANDWYLIPYELPVGTIAKVKGMSVSNVFGENFWLEPSGRGGDEDWDRWNMFTLNLEGHENVASDTSMLLLPTVPKIQESKPVEEITFIRDEMANMVWAIETKIPLAHGESVSGSGAASQYHSYLQRLSDIAGSGGSVPLEAGEGAGAPIRYDIMSQIPENWIPFIPVHVPDQNRHIQLQRAAMPRILEASEEKPDKVRPRTSLLKGGLEEKEPFFVYDEEVSRNGIVVSQSYQRTRWKNGRVYLWFGSRKTTGRGEGSSGLAFDRILPVKKKSEPG